MLLPYSTFFRSCVFKYLFLSKFRSYSATPDLTFIKQHPPINQSWKFLPSTNPGNSFHPLNLFITKTNQSSNLYQKTHYCLLVNGWHCFYQVEFHQVNDLEEFHQVEFHPVEFHQVEFHQVEFQPILEIHELTVSQKLPKKKGLKGGVKVRKKPSKQLAKMLANCQLTVSKNP